VGSGNRPGRRAITEIDFYLQRHLTTELPFLSWRVSTESKATR
jgi:hypothetical protein